MRLHGGIEFVHVIYMGECSWVALGRSLVVLMRFGAEDNANRHVNYLAHLHGGNALESLLSPLFFSLVSSLLPFLVSSLFSRLSFLALGRS